MLDYRNVTQASPRLGDSQLKFRLGLARQRTTCYPLDRMDFILLDLERPDRGWRHAHKCMGDLTGRLLEFLSFSDGVDGHSDPRLRELFERILRTRQPSGLLGNWKPNGTEQSMRKSEMFLTVGRFFPGLIRYHQLTGDMRAFDAAETMANVTVKHIDDWRRWMKKTGGRQIPAWITEPMTMMFSLTGRKEYLDVVAMIDELLESPEKGAHAHGFCSTLRGLQLAALVTGDMSWNVKPEKYRRLIIERHFETPDGCPSEMFPASAANEGCATADWLMVNLNAALLASDDDAYDHAERIFWNALAFNQWINGSFGHRTLTANGYGLKRLEEAWWCCCHDAGLAMTEYARHVVTLRDRTISVNLLVPGVYTLPLGDGRTATLRIVTGWPTSVRTIVEAEGVPADFKLRLRIPTSIRRPKLTERREGRRVTLTLQGRIGHYVEECWSGIMLKYGPLVLAPMVFSMPFDTPTIGRSLMPPDYNPDVVPKGLPELLLPSPDGDGLLKLTDEPMDWTFFEEGPNAPCGVEGSPALLKMKFIDGKVAPVRFAPLCYATSVLILCETPVVFAGRKTRASASRRRPKRKTGKG